MRVASLRGGPMAQRAAATADVIAEVLAAGSRAPNLVAGAVLRATVAGHVAYFEADAVAASARGTIRAAEVKSFPVVDGRA